MNIKIERLLDLATGAALTRVHRKSPHTVQHFRLGAAGIRFDGALVVSYNGSQEEPRWQHHAESRLCRKLTPKSIVAVARVLADGSWAMARPCKNCETCLRRLGVKRVYYTIAPDEFGTLIFLKEVNNTWKKLFKLFLSFLLVCLLLVLLLAFCLLALFGGWCIEMKTYEKLRNATSVKEAEKIMKEFWDSYVESEEHGRILQSIYDCYNSGMDKNDPCLVKLSKDLEREERRLWIEHGLYPEDYDFDRVLTEEEAKRAIEWFGGSQGE